MENQIKPNSSINGTKSIDNSTKKDISLDKSISLSFPEPTKISNTNFEATKESKVSVNVGVSRVSDLPTVSVSMPTKISEILKSNKDLGTDKTTIQQDLYTLRNEGERLDKFTFGTDQRSIFKNYMNKIVDTPELASKFSPTEIQEIKSIIGKISRDFLKESSLTPEEIMRLKVFLDSVGNKVDPNQLSKSDLNTLQLMLVNVQMVDVKLPIICGDMKVLRNQITDSIDEIIKNIENVSPKTGITDVMNILYENYKKALDSGNEGEIARYAKLIGDVSNTIKNRGSGSDISKLVADYNNNVRTITNESATIEQRDSAITNTLTSEENENLTRRAKINLHRRSTPDTNPSNNLNVIKPINHTNTGTANPTIGHEVQLTPDQISTERVRLAMEGMTEGVNEGVNTGSHIGRSVVIPIEIKIDPQVITNLQKMTSEDIKSVFDRNPKLQKSMDKCESLTNKYREAKKELDMLILNINSSSTKFENRENIKSKLDIIIKNNIDALIESALKFEGKLNLEIDGSSGSIVSLLEKFRSIITTLESDTKLNLKRSLEALSISNIFSSQKRDMELRWSSLDKAKKELNEIMKSIQESKIA